MDEDARENACLLVLNGLAIARRQGSAAYPAVCTTLAGLALSIVTGTGGGFNRDDDDGEGEGEGEGGLSIPGEIRRAVDDALFDASSTAQEAMQGRSGDSLHCSMLVSCLVRVAESVGVATLSEASPASMSAILGLVPSLGRSWIEAGSEDQLFGAVAAGLFLCELVLSGSVDSAADHAFAVPG